MPTPSPLTKLARTASTEEVVLSEHLADLRGRVRLLTWVSGLCWMSLVFLGGLLVTGTLDWLIHFDESGTRLIFGLALLAGSGWVFWRYLIAPLREQLTATFLASRIERRFPGMNNRIVSAVEFLEHRLDERLGSTEMQKHVVWQALKDLVKVEAADVVETKAIRAVTIAGSLVFISALLVAILHPLEAATSVQRLALPFANVPWPRAVELQLVRADLSPVEITPDKPMLIARGDTLDLYVRNKRGKLPERVWFEYRTGEEGPVIRESLRQTTIRDDKGKSFDTAMISWIATGGSMSFRASGGDDNVMPFQQIEVVPPPVIKSLQVILTPPAYSRRPVETLPPGVGHVQGLLGTKVEITAECDKSLQSAALVIANQPPVPLTLQPGQRQLTATFEIKTPSTSSYWFELTDTLGFTDREPIRYELRGVADAIPEVGIESPASDVLLTADAELPVKILAKDDLGLREIRLAYQINDDEKRHNISLFRSDSPAEPVSATEATTESENRQPTGPQHQELDYLWKMADLHPEPGTRIVFRAEATDDYDIGPPHVGTSIPRTILIVSRDEKQKDLATRVGNLLTDLNQAAQLQQRARQLTQELQTQLDSVGELRSEDLDQLRRAELEQRQAASRLTQPADGIESQARQLLDEFRGNHLNDSATEQRLEHLSEELGRLEREELPQAEQALTKAQKLAEETSQRKDPQSKTDRGDSSATDRQTPKNGSEKSSSKSKQDSDAKDSIDNKDTANNQAESGTAGEKKDDDKKSKSKIAGPNGDRPTDKNDPDRNSDVTEQEASVTDKSRGTSPEPGQQPTEERPAEEKPTDKKLGDPGDSEKKPESRRSQPEAELNAALDEAQARQTHSLETLQELQQSLSEWRDRRDVASDLNSVINEQQAIQNEASELAQRTMTKSDAELTKQEKAELNKLAARQRKVAEQLDQFRKQLEQTAKSLQENDPDMSERFNDVGEQLKAQETASKLQDAAQAIADHKMGSAAEAQQKAMEELRESERMMKRLPTEDTEQFLKQAQEAQQDFQQLRQEQQELADHAQDLNKQPDSPEKEEQMKQLMEQQEELVERMAKAERKLERLRLRGAADAANRARQRLSEMMKDMRDADEGEAEEMQQAMNEALDDLEQVERELVLEKRIAQERLAFEQLEKIEDELKSLRARQETIIEETIRLDAAKAERETLSRGQLRTLKDLAENERALNQVAEQMQQQMASAEVFSLVLKRLARTLKLAADQLGERETSAATQALEKDAIRKIDSLLAVLKQEQKKQEKPEQPQQKPEELANEPQEQEQKPEEAQPPGSSIPQLAQLKLLKTMQEEYLERTELLEKFRGKDGKLPDAMQAEKNELAQEQSELADLARNLITKFLQQQPEQMEQKKSQQPEQKPQEPEQPKEPEKKEKQKVVDPNKIDL